MWPQGVEHHWQFIRTDPGTGEAFLVAETRTSLSGNRTSHAASTLRHREAPGEVLCSSRCAGNCASQGHVRESQGLLISCWSSQ